MNPQNQAMEQALAGGGGAPAAPQGGPQTPMPGIPPELVELAYALGLDLNNPEDLAILLQMLGQGGGGPLGPMAGAAPGGASFPPAGY
ncbi:MAG TPA: hypothetical protein VEA69_02830 [Tepidisphaeraceae bacterium]|nr:hypothetical protein [Tepidisphaeraceae bacterium]